MDARTGVAVGAFTYMHTNPGHCLFGRLAGTGELECVSKGCLLVRTAIATYPRMRNLMTV